MNSLFAHNATKSYNAKFADDAVNTMEATTAVKAGEVNLAYRAEHATYAVFAVYAENKVNLETGRFSLSFCTLDE